MTDSQPLTNPDDEIPARKRGAPPGNINALKHGFYSKRFNTGELLDLLDIPEGSIHNEIAVLRVLTRRVVELMENDAPDPVILEFYKIVGQMCMQISTLLRTQKLLDGNEEGRAIIFKALGQATSLIFNFARKTE